MKLPSLVFIGVFLMATVSRAELKIAVVDVQKAVHGSNSGKKASAEIEKEFEKKKQDLLGKEAELKKKAEEYEKKKAVLSDKARDEQQGELQKDMMAFREEVSKNQNFMGKKQQELLKPILDKIQSAIAQVAKEKELKIVLEKSEQNVMWSSADLDITGEVIKKVNL